MALHVDQIFALFLTCSGTRFSTGAVFGTPLSYRATIPRTQMPWLMWCYENISFDGSMVMQTVLLYLQFIQRGAPCRQFRDNDVGSSSGRAVLARSLSSIFNEVCVRAA